MMVLVPGCKRSGSAGNEAQNFRASGSNTLASPSAAGPVVIAKMHWLGKKQIAQQTNAAQLMTIWSLPLAMRLEGQTLDKLALSPWGLPQPATNSHFQITNYQALLSGPSALLRPLLQDLVEDESYLEARGATNQPTELVLAVKLEDARAALWSTNLALILESLGGSRLSAAQTNSGGWQIQITNRFFLAPNQASSQIQLVRAGNWTFLGLNSASNELLGEMQGRLTKRQFPTETVSTNAWLSVDLDLERMKDLLPTEKPFGLDWPRVTMVWSGYEGNVRTRGELVFDKPLNLQLHPWQVPTNLIRGPLVSITVFQGFGSWLAVQPWVQTHQIQGLPNQLFCWALKPSPALSFWTMRMPGAGTNLERLAPQILPDINAWLTNHSRPPAEFDREHCALTWEPLPLAVPTIRAVRESDGEYLVFGMSRSAPKTPEGVPAELLERLGSRTNLVYYNWEMTEARLYHWLFLGQTGRFLADYPQIPPYSATIGFLTNSASKLTAAVTEIAQVGPGQLSVARRSSLGLTSAEMQLLADWLESPTFPHGLYTFVTPKPPKLVPHKRGTNTVSHPPSVPLPLH